MKILLSAALVSTLLLTWCGDETTTTAVPESSATTTYESPSGWSMTVPRAWTAVETKSVPVPKEGKVELALTSSELKGGFANNVIILSDTLTSATTSLKYAIVNQALTARTYYGYTDLGSERITFGDDEVGSASTFEAQYSAKTSKQKFLQSAKVCGNTVYVITFGVGIDTASMTKYRDLVTSFTCPEK